MNEVSVDLLVIGDVACATYASCASNGDIICGGNRVEITESNIPDHIDLYGKRLHFKNAIVMNAKGFHINMISTLVPDGKHIFVTGYVYCGGILKNRRNESN